MAALSSFARWVPRPCCAPANSSGCSLRRCPSNPLVPEPKTPCCLLVARYLKRCPHTSTRSPSKPDAGSFVATVHLTFLPCESAGSNSSKCCHTSEVRCLFPCPAPTLTAVLLAELSATGTAVSVPVAVSGSPDEAVGVTGADALPPSPAVGVLAMCCATSGLVLWCFVLSRWSGVFFSFSRAGLSTFGPPTP